MPEAEVIVADSSSDDNKKLNQKIVNSIGNSRWTHLLYEPSIFLHNKIAAVAQHATQKYSLICADDDFILPEGIAQAINFLESNQDFVMAHGEYINFHIQKKDHRVPEFKWNKIYPHTSIDFPKPEARLLMHLRHYAPTMYAVHRTSTLQHIYNETLKNQLSSGALDPGELFTSALTSLLGKMKSLAILYGARQADATIIHSKPTSLRTATEEEHRYREDYTKLKQSLVTNLSRYSTLSNNELEHLANSAVSNYFKSSKRRAWKIYFYNKIKNTIKKLPGLYRRARFFYKIIKKVSVDTTSDTHKPLKGLDALRSYVLWYDCHRQQLAKKFLLSSNNER